MLYLVRADGRSDPFGGIMKNDGRFIKGQPSKGMAFKKGQIPWNKGKKMTPEYCETVSRIQKGKKLSEEHKANIAKGLFKGSLDRKGLLYRNWKKAVLIRDNYTCQKCGTKNKLVAHHIIDYKLENGGKDVKLMTDIENGLTLCAPCHHKLHREQDKTGFVDGHIPWNKNTKGLTGWQKGRKRGDPPNKGLKGIRDPLTGKISFKQPLQE